MQHAIHAVLRFFLIALPLGAVAMFNLGMDYIEIGYGLHPAISFPLAAFSISLTLLIFLHLAQTDMHPIYRDKTDHPFGITE